MGLWVGKVNFSVNYRCSEKNQVSFTNLDENMLYDGHAVGAAVFHHRKIIQPMLDISSDQ